MVKRTSAIVVALLLSFCILPMLTDVNVANANGGPTFTVPTNVPGTRGSPLTMQINVSNNPGFVATTLLMTYDPNVLVITGFTSAVTGMPLNPQHALTTKPGSQWIPLVNQNLIDWSGNGTVVNVSFNVLPNAPTGVSPVYLSFISSPSGVPANSDGDILSGATANGGSVVVAGNGPDDDTRTLIEIIKPASINNLMHGTPKTKEGLGLPDTVIAVIEDSNGQRTQEVVNVTWDVANCPYVVNASTSLYFTVFGNVTLPSDVRNPNNKRAEIDVSVNGPGVGQYTLIRVINPNPITGLPNGTPKTDTGLSLPEAVRMETTGGNVWTTVDWNTSECSYNPANKNEQTFIVDGMAHLPAGVNNFNNISKAVKVSVTVGDKITTNPPPPPAGDFIGNPYTQDSTGIVNNNTNSVIVNSSSGSSSSSSYGRVPQTGIADHTALIPAIAVSLMITIILVVYIVRSKSLKSGSEKV